MLNRTDKENIISSLKADIDKAKAVFLTNLIGVKSNDGVAIRKNVRDAKGKLVVARNTLFKKAAQGTNVESMVADLKGPHALAFAYDDAAAVAKCLKEASDSHEVVQLKAGLLGETKLNLKEVIQLASLPSKNEMLGTLLATFNAPVSAFARVLNAIREQKEAGGGEVQQG